MITAVDSSVLLDILHADPIFCQSSLQSLRSARAQGALIACPAVWAEVGARFSDSRSLRSAMAGFELAFDPFDQAAAEAASLTWRTYRQAGGKRDRIVADFLIGAHALARGGRLLSRDAGFFRRYFRDLEIIC